MKRLTLWLSAGLILLACVVLGRSGRSVALPAGDDQAKQLLARMENDWGDANVRQDGAALKRILSDDLTFTTYDGKILDRAGVIESVMSTKMESDQASDIVVRVYSAAAVVTGRSTVTFRTKSGLNSETFRWTDTFVKFGAVWKCVASQEVRLHEQ